jgi:hypothetical protein
MYSSSHEHIHHVNNAAMAIEWYIYYAVWLPVLPSALASLAALSLVPDPWFSLSPSAHGSDSRSVSALHPSLQPCTEWHLTDAQVVLEECLPNAMPHQHVILCLTQLPYNHYVITCVPESMIKHTHACKCILALNIGKCLLNVQRQWVAHDLEPWNSSKY